MKNVNPPVIVVGMHRSGTSLLTRILENQGMFVGTSLDDQHEPVFFQSMNSWLLQHAGGRWDWPEPFLEIHEETSFRSAMLDVIKQHITSIYSIQFWGLKNYILMRSGDRQEFRWGWKDPRNSITLPYWLELFPSAKVIHIKRHGADVARSLRERAKKNTKHNRNSLHWWQRSKDLLKVCFPFNSLSLHSFKISSLEHTRCLSLEGGLGLWEAYLDQIKSTTNRMDEKNFLECKFEDLVQYPAKTIHQITRFCDIQKDIDMDSLIPSIDQGKANRWKDHSELREFSENYQTVLSKFGY